ncbi:hypothetical protein E2562_009158 [Oryza meyeriana var. granulata]|uniref:Uncharacterized protein n=1 Tax=Oryza meyeriana var. granulata TaxID=110450 RepID=A0A6G1CDF1_9ORYZ|nr:hypothetical protein E2562_009158 [Oryza meyeriana var. granulata]
MINGAHLRPHLQVEELHVTEGKKILDVQVSGKLGQEDEHIHRGEVVKVPMRMAIAHKGGGTGGVGGVGGPGGGASGGRTNVNGGAADTRPHTGRNSGAAMPAPAKTSILALAFTCAVVLSSFSF